MPHFKLMVMSRPVGDREDEYNDWYQNIHLGELVAIPGIKSARRYREVRTLSAENAYPYVSMYEIETDDIDTVLQSISGAAAKGQMNMSDALDTATVYAVVYEEFGEEVHES